MYMTIGEFHERLGQLLKDHPELDRNSLLVDMTVINDQSTGDYVIGTGALVVAEKVYNDKYLNPWTLYVKPPFIERTVQ